MDSPNLSDTTAMTSEASDAATALSASEQARLRRERRKAKVGQGADRLKKITQTQKGPGFDTSYADDGMLILYFAVLHHIKTHFH